MSRAPAFALVFLVFSERAFAPIMPADAIGEEAAEGVTVHFGGQDSASFHRTNGLVTQIDVQARGMTYTVPLDCVAGGGLSDVRYDTAKLLFITLPGSESDRTVALHVYRGREEERTFGVLPRVELHFNRGRLSELRETRMMSPSSSGTDKLCATLPVPPRPLCAAGVPPPRGLDSAEAVVERLRPLPASLPPTVVYGERAQAEKLRGILYEQLLALDEEAVAALARALRDPDVSMRRNVTLAFGVLSGGWWSFECGHKQLDVSAALPALRSVLADEDSSVRAWSAQAIGNVGADAANAVPDLIEMLEHGDEGARNSAALALRGIGPAASAALPALRRALSDPSTDVRRFASNAIERIEGG